jgi:hypothetical protein
LQVWVPLIAFPARAQLEPQPLGVILVFSCWNVPLGKQTIINLSQVTAIFFPSFTLLQARALAESAAAHVKHCQENGATLALMNRSIKFSPILCRDKYSYGCLPCGDACC